MPGSRRGIAAATAVAAAGVAATVVLTGGSGSAATSTGPSDWPAATGAPAKAAPVAGAKTLNLRAYRKEHVTVRAGGKGLYHVGNYSMFNETIRDRAGRAIGAVSARCTINFDSTSLCDGEIGVHTRSTGGYNGALSFYGSSGGPYAVTGGTGDLRGARGTFTAYNYGQGNDKYTLLSVTLLP